MPDAIQCHTGAEYQARCLEAHRANFMRKLNLQTQTDLVRYAIRRGLIQA